MARIVKQGNCTCPGGEKGALKYALTDDGTLTISGQGVLYSGGTDKRSSAPRTNILDSSDVHLSQFKDMDIKRVVIDEGVTGLQEFSLCELPMTEVVLTSTVTHIGHAVFMGCTRLKTVVLPSTMQRIEEHAFDGCESLSAESLALIGKYRDTPAVIGGLSFVLRPQLREAVLVRSKYPSPATYFQEPYYEGDLVVPATVMHDSIEYTVAGISHIEKYKCTSITLPATISFIDDAWISASVDFAPSNVRIADVAAWCRVKLLKAECGYNNIEFPTRNRHLYLGDSTEPVTELVIPGGVTEIAHSVFNSCKDLRKVVLPQGLKKIGCWAFEGCSGIENINIPDSVTEIGNGAFYGCSGLREISTPNPELLGNVLLPSGVKIIAERS